MRHDSLDSVEDLDTRDERSASSEANDVNQSWRPSKKDVKRLLDDCAYYVLRKDVDSLADSALMNAYVWYFAHHAPAVFLRSRRADIDDLRLSATRYYNKLRLFPAGLEYVGGVSMTQYAAMTGRVVIGLRSTLKKADERSSTARSLACEASLLMELFRDWNLHAVRKRTSSLAGFEKLLVWIFSWMKQTTELPSFICPLGIPTFAERRSVRDMVERNKALLAVRSPLPLVAYKKVAKSVHLSDQSP